jgi:hypothetical protein
MLSGSDLIAISELGRPPLPDPHLWGWGKRLLAPPGSPRPEAIEPVAIGKPTNGQQSATWVETDIRKRALGELWRL